MQWKVRQTIASSLYRLAEIVGIEVTQSDLLPVFTEMLSDVDEVRAALVQHFTDFVLVCTHTVRFHSALTDGSLGWLRCTVGRTPVFGR